MIRKLLDRQRATHESRQIGRRLLAFQKRSAQLPARPKSPWTYEILIPTYNHAKYLPTALNSSVEQTFNGKYSIRIVDDCSQDETQSVIAQLLPTLKRKAKIQYSQNKQNLRQWASINSAVKASKADIIVILNDDDVLFPDALEKIDLAFMQHSELFLVGSTSLWFTQGSEIRKAKRDSYALDLSISHPDEVGAYRDLNDLNMTHSSMAFFKVAWKLVGGYTPKSDRIHAEANEDRDFQMRVAALFPTGVYTDYPLAMWRTDSSHGKDY